MKLTLSSFLCFSFFLGLSPDNVSLILSFIDLVLFNPIASFRPGSLVFVQTEMVISHRDALLSGKRNMIAVKCLTNAKSFD